MTYQEYVCGVELVLRRYYGAEVDRMAWRAWDDARDVARNDWPTATYKFWATVADDVYDRIYPPEEEEA